MVTIMDTQSCLTHMFNVTTLLSLAWLLLHPLFHLVIAATRFPLEVRRRRRAILIQQEVDALMGYPYDYLQVKVKEAGLRVTDRRAPSLALALANHYLGV